MIGQNLAEIACLRSQLTQKEKEMEEMTKSWQDKLKRSEQRKREEAQSLEKAGVSFQVGTKNAVPSWQLCTSL